MNVPHWLQSVQVGFVLLPSDVAKNIKVMLLRQWHTSCDNFYQAFSALFVLQATMAVMEDWERGYLITTVRNATTTIGFLYGSFFLYK